jgi:hypothetical protein
MDLGAGTIAAVLAALALLLILVSVALVLPRVLAVRRRLKELRGVLAAEAGLLELELERLQALGETWQLELRPYARARRWATHPLTIALVQSLRRRRTAR